MTSGQRTPPPGPRAACSYEQGVIDRIADFNDPRQEWRRLFSELLGTFFLVLVAAGGGMMGQAFPGMISVHVRVQTPPTATPRARCPAIRRLGRRGLHRPGRPVGQPHLGRLHEPGPYVRPRPGEQDLYRLLGVRGRPPCWRRVGGGHRLRVTGPGRRQVRRGAAQATCSPRCTRPASPEHYLSIRRWAFAPAGRRRTVSWCSAIGPPSP